MAITKLEYETHEDYDGVTVPVPATMEFDAAEYTELFTKLDETIEGVNLRETEITTEVSDRENADIAVTDAYTAAINTLKTNIKTTLKIIKDKSYSTEVTDSDIDNGF